MLQYPDLRLADINYYWSGSILLRESKGRLLPCTLGNIDSSSSYPITLIDMATGERHINLKLKTFVRTVLIHHPSLGYGDYNGVPVYLAPRAGREKRKGLDTNNITALCPVDWAAAVNKCLAELTEEARRIASSNPRGSLPRSLTKRYNELKRLVVQVVPSLGDGTQYIPRNLRQPRRRLGVPNQSNMITIRDDKMWASIIAQSVNNDYPPVRSARRTLRTTDVVGVSVSRNFALVRSNDVDSGTVKLYHRMSCVGTMSLESGAITFDKKLSKHASSAMELAFNNVIN